MLHFCSEQLEKDEKDESGNNSNGGENADENQDEEKSSSGNDSHLAFAVIGIALIAMGEEIGSQMVLRMFNHLVRIGMLFL